MKTLGLFPGQQKYLLFLLQPGLRMLLSYENLSLSSYSKHIRHLHRALLDFVCAQNALARVVLTVSCARIVMFLVTVWCCLVLLTVC